MVREQEARFARLLRPISDVALAWGVDIASALESYLEELKVVDITPESSCASLRVNFVDAAYLVQGSASIYSKKVEHLYALVIHAISVIKGVPEKRNATARYLADDAPDSDADILFKETEFLLLDNIIQQTVPEEINLPSDSTGGPEGASTLLVEAPPSLSPHIRVDDNGPQKEFTLRDGRAVLHHSGMLLVEGMECDDLPCADTAALALDFQGDQVSGVYDNDIGGDEYNGPYRESKNGCDHGNASELMAGAQMKVVEAYLGEETQDLRRRISIEIRQKDPFWLHDPHDPSGMVAGPFRNGRTAGGRKAEKVSRKGGRRGGKNRQTIISVLEGAFESPSKRKGANFVRCPDLQDRFKDISLARKSALKNLRRCFRNLQGSSYDESGSFRDHDAKIVERYDDDNDSFDGGHEPLVFNEQAQQFETHAADDRKRPDIDWQGEATVQTMAEQREEHCRQYLAEISKGWEQHVIQNKLIERVEIWTRTILPILEEEEMRPPFDIYDYGKSIIAAFHGRCHSFQIQQTAMSRLLSAPQKYHFCRNFLSTLQLANEGSIRILPAPGVSDPVLELTHEFETSMKISRVGTNWDETLDKENVSSLANVILATTPITASTKKRSRKALLIPQSTERKSRNLRLR